MNDLATLLGNLDFDDLNLDDTDLVAGALVIVKVIDGDGNLALMLRSAGMGWIERIGALHYATAAETSEPSEA